jgi:hypothetical protein
MPSIAIHTTDLTYPEHAISDWIRRRGLCQWYGHSDKTRGEGDELGLHGIDFADADQQFGMFWMWATDAALNELLPYNYKLDSRGNADFSHAAIPTGNDLPDDLVNITGYEDLRDEILTVYKQALTDWIAERETGSEEQLLDLFREVFTPHLDYINRRLQGFISRFEHCAPDLQPVALPTISEVKYLFDWLSKQDPNLYATVTDDGILAVEANLGPLGRLFVEVDRSGLLEATIVSTEFGIRGLDVATISELTSVPIASLIGGP